MSVADGWSRDLPADPHHKSYLTICYVCRDVAKPGTEHLRNYGGIVCYSCRAFWRRSHQASRRPTFVCKRNDDCIITVATRRRCQKCRYDRCAAAGMRSDAVLNEDQKKIRFRKLLMKRQKQLAKQMKTKKGFEKGTKRVAARRTTSKDFDYLETESMHSDNSLDMTRSTVSSNSQWNEVLTIQPGLDFSPSPIEPLEPPHIPQYFQQRNDMLELYPNYSIAMLEKNPADLNPDYQDHDEELLLDLSIKREVIIEESVEAKVSRITDSYVDVIKNLRCYKTDLVLNNLSALRSGYDRPISVSDLQLLMLKSSEAFTQFALSLREFVSLDHANQEDLLSRNTPLFAQYFLGHYLLVEPQHGPKDSRFEEQPKKKVWMANFAQNLYLEKFNSVSGLFSPGADLDKYGRLIVKLKGLYDLNTCEQTAVLAYILLFYPGGNDDYVTKELNEMFGYYIRTSEDCINLPNLVTTLSGMVNFCSDNIEWNDYDYTRSHATPSPPTHAGIYSIY